MQKFEHLENANSFSDEKKKKNIFDNYLRAIIWLKK